jgi:16S rRNA (guanine966-N2)-methyltransferase
MRVVSGKYKRANLNGFDINGTRPTMDRIKESMFALIQGSIKDSVCLDLFAGSGALGIEAISNGARACYFVDNNNIAIKTLQDNLTKLRVNEEYHIVSKDYKQALQHFKDNNIKFDLILLDPPYNNTFIKQSIDLITNYDLLNDGGYIVCEYEQENFENEFLECIKEKKYGSKNIKILKKV